MKLNPTHYSLATLAACQALAIAVSLRQQVFIEEEGIVLPEISAGPPLVYFFLTVAVLGLTLAFLPLRFLKYLIKGMFLLLYAWGVFVVLGLSLPAVAAGIIAAMGALAWLKWPRLWLHNLLLGVALAGYGSVFGFILAPGAVLVIMAVISIYDLVSVKSGHMMWMVKKLSGVAIVPAFVFPRRGADWSLELSDLRLENEADERIVSLLGGGDVGFALILLVSVLAAAGIVPAILTAGALMLGLLSVFWVQRAFFKGGPTPAIPPITAAAGLGYGLMLLTGIV